jgi:hypothetical protein
MSMCESKFIWLQSFKKRKLVKIQERQIKLILFNEFSTDNSSMADLRVMNVVYQNQGKQNDND